MVPVGKPKRQSPAVSNSYSVEFFEGKQQQFTDPLDQETYNEYLQELYDQEEKVERYDARIEELSRLDAYRERVEKLRCFKGIDTHTALSLVCEIGDFSRFATAAQFSAFLGSEAKEIHLQAHQHTCLQYP